MREKLHFGAPSHRRTRAASIAPWIPSQALFNFPESEGAVIELGQANVPHGSHCSETYRVSGFLHNKHRCGERHSALGVAGRKSALSDRRRTELGWSLGCCARTSHNGQLRYVSGRTKSLLAPAPEPTDPNFNHLNQPTDNKVGNTNPIHE